MESNSIIKVLKAGMLTTIQDLGRYGFQQYGVVVSGAMDPFSLRVANLLVGNDEGDACIEVTLIGPTLHILQDTLIAITGGDLTPELNGISIPMWRSIKVAAGSTLTFGKVKSGCRAYIAVRGGIDVPVIMGSRSTYLRAGIGGYHGRALMREDILSFAKMGVKEHEYSLLTRSLMTDLIPRYSSPYQIRILLGPHDHLFTKNSLHLFFKTTYKITPDSDRMGYRLSGERLQLQESAELISEAIPLGTIQVPPQGEPIILLADHQTTGGYPKIGTCITVDIPKLAQAKPGEEITFQLITLEESYRLLKEQEFTFHQLKLANYQQQSN